MDMFLGIIGFAVVLMLIGAWLGKRQTRDRMQNCDTREAEVMTVTQNYGSKNYLSLTLQLRLTDEQGKSRLASLSERIKIADAPRPGDKVLIWVDRRAPDKVYYRGLAANFRNAAIVQEISTQGTL